MLLSSIRFVLLFVSLALVLVPNPECAPQELVGRVIDENGLAVAGAQVMLSGEGLPSPVSATSDEAGRFVLPSVSSGTYFLRVEKPGFYAFVSSTFAVAIPARPVEVVLNHRQEFEETVSVVYSAPVIDRQEAAVRTSITSEEVIDLPFSATHDFRNALPLIPGVVKDNLGRLHMNGGGEDQAYYTLDGFTVTSPASGTLENRISVDAIRTVQIETSRYTAEYGKGSAGVMALETKRGDDRFRFSATNFLPSYEFHDGLTLSNWTPRGTVSGPIVKGRAWYFNALDLQYDLNTLDELPSAANTNRNWFGSNMSLVQVNLTNSNILASSFLFNFQDSYHLGITPLDPVETSRHRRERFYFFSLKDQAYFRGGWILETGLGLNRTNIRERPEGDQMYVISPEGRSGNYFLSFDRHVERLQTLADVTSPFWQRYGRHNLKFGIDANRLRYRQLSNRRPIEVRRLQGSRLRLVNFWGNPSMDRSSSEFSAFVQERWFPNDRVLVDVGIRLDWDQVLRQVLGSPRLAVAWGPRQFPDSKFSAGIGVFRDATNMELLTRGLDQRRLDTFFDSDGTTVRASPIQTQYVVDEKNLKASYYLNWSLGWEQKLPNAFYLRTNFIRKRGYNGWSYDFMTGPTRPHAVDGTFRLGNLRRDKYSYLELTLTRAFKDKYPWLLSYARSSARSSAVVDFSLDNPIFGSQGSGPLDWDTPNRLISWGLFPLFSTKYTLAYFMEWHSGLPFSVVNESQQFVGALNSSRFPDYFSMNVHIERRFRFLRYQWAFRAGFNNIMGRRNPMVVDNNIDSPTFGRFSGGQDRAFTGRIRFLGKS